MGEYLITAGPPALFIWLLVTGRIVPRAARPDLPQRPLGWWRRRWIQLRRPAIVDDLYDLRRELEDPDDRS